MTAPAAPILPAPGTAESTRAAYGDTLLELGAERPDVVVLTADLGTIITLDRFGTRFPDRYINVGVAEQNLAGIAAGLATVGLTPFLSTFAVFASMRMCEQVRTSICYPKLNVKIVPSHGGITIGENGVTHQALEDIGIMRLFPNMTVVVPADGAEVRQAVRAAAAWDGPVYVRLGRPSVPALFAPDHRFRIGPAYRVRDGRDVVIMSTGILLAEAMRAADDLVARNVRAEILHVPTVKPIDADTVLASAVRTGAVVTVEEHSIVGGLGSAVAEVLAETGAAVMRRVGVRDTFAESGTPAELLEKYGLTAPRIVDACLKAIAARG